MAGRRRRFQRTLGERRYKKMFLLSVEGAKTERQYFAFFDDSVSLIKVKCIEKKNESSPQAVLRKMNEQISKEGLKKNDEAWLVLDKNGWSDSQLMKLYEWSASKNNYHVALSNPNFEYWLLLHFDDCKGTVTAKSCSERLKRHIPDYNKNIDRYRFTNDMIAAAIKRARLKDSPPCDKWPVTTGTTVYRLVEKIFLID